MKDKLIIKLDILMAKVGYILANLSSYSSLDLSKRVKNINENLYLLKRSVMEENPLIDIRDVIKQREALRELALKANINETENVYFEGHKISCLFFELSSEFKLLQCEMEEENQAQDYIDYLQVVANYTYVCGRYINKELLCFENKID